MFNILIYSNNLYIFHCHLRFFQKHWPSSNWTSSGGRTGARRRFSLPILPPTKRSAPGKCHTVGRCECFRQQCKHASRQPSVAECRTRRAKCAADANRRHPWTTRPASPHLTRNIFKIVMPSIGTRPFMIG